MESTHQHYKRENFFGARLNDKFPGFEEKWLEIVAKAGDEFVNYIKERIQDQYRVFTEISNFRITVVVDNNFVFGQIKNLVEKNKPLKDSFLYRMTTLKSVKIYAPPALVKELYEKIETVLIGDKVLAKQYAEVMLKNIEVKDAFWIDEWKKANNLMGHIDIDDVPYLPLAIEVGSHAIISRDAHFRQQGASRVWTVQFTDKIITNYHSGCLSFCFLGTMPSILQRLWEVLMIFFKVLGEVLQSLVFALGCLAAGSFELIGKIPNEILVFLLGLSLISAIFSANFRASVGNAMVKIGEVIRTCLEAVGRFIVWIVEFLTQLWDVFKPIGVTFLEFAGFFIYEYAEMKLEVELLESEKAK